MIDALIRGALIQDLAGSPDALTFMQKALVLAKPGSFIRVFLDWGRPMQQLLQQVDAGDQAVVKRLLAAFAEELDSAESPTPSIQLTDRENEILQLIASVCLTNKSKTPSSSPKYRPYPHQKPLQQTRRE